MSGEGGRVRGMEIYLHFMLGCLVYGLMVAALLTKE